MMEYEEGGLSDQGGTVDPVSGNEVPPGALQEEVRDDIDAKLSEGEFVFPADVVRYIGLEKLMMMRQQAKQGLSMMEKMGQMSNADEAVMEDTAPAAVFDIPDDMDMPAVMVAELEMAEGGDVQGEKRYKSFRELMGTDGDTAEIVTYVNDAGRKIIIMHMNGAPVSQVPEGFYPEGTEPSEETEVTPEQPPAAPQVQPQQRFYREDDPSDPPEKRGGGVIHTGGYIDSQQGRVIGSTAWDISYDLDGSVTLNNSEHGEVTLTKEEAQALDLGLQNVGFGAFVSNFTPSGYDEKRARQQVLSSGEFGNPANGNEVHKAIIEKAQLQKMGKQFVEQNSDKMGLADSLKAAFGQGEPNEIEGNIAQILGKNSNQFTSADYAIIGQALSGTPNQYNLPGSTQTDAAKLKQISDAIDEIQSGQFADMSLPKPKPTRDDRGLGGLGMPDITLGKIGDSNDDPPGPGSILSPPSGISGDDPFFDGDQPGTPGSSDDGFPTAPDPLPDVTVDTQPGAVFDDDDDGPSGSESYSIGSGAPVDAFNERPSLGNPTSPSLGRGMTSSQHSAFRFNKGALVKKRKGLASR